MFGRRVSEKCAAAASTCPIARVGLFFVKITPQGNHIIKRWMGYKLVYIVAHIKGANAAPQRECLDAPFVAEANLFVPMGTAGII
jgi:hypothetical protein